MQQWYMQRRREMRVNLVGLQRIVAFTLGCALMSVSATLAARERLAVVVFAPGEPA
jgi:hypothetical protein